MHNIVNKPPFLKEAPENCGFQEKSLLNINNFRGIINPMRAYKDATTSYVALFCCMGQVVCVFIIQKHACPQACNHHCTNKHGSEGKELLLAVFS